MLNPSNFSHFSLYSDDEVTRKVIEESEEVHDEIAIVYKSFMRTINLVRLKRIEAGITDNEMNNFTLSLKSRFLGETAEETGRWFSEMMDNAFKEIQKGNVEEI